MPTSAPPTINHLPEQSAELLNATSLARRWDTSTGQLANMRSQGRGPRYVKLGSRVMYRLEDVRAYELAQVVTTIDHAPTA